MRKPHLVTKDKVLEGPQHYWIADTKTTEAILGFHPRRTTAQGIAETYAWYESQGRI
jgi:nucleoside-diphosphate-sugar epimerase